MSQHCEEQLPTCSRDMAHMRENIDLKLDIIMNSITSMKNETNIRLTAIEIQTTKTNGRVDKIEKHGAFWLWLGENWEKVIMVTAALITLVYGYLGLIKK